MTREEAIQYAEKKIDSASYRLEMGYLNNGLRQIVSNEYEFFMQALSALRQQKHFRDLTKKVEPLTNAQKIRSMTDEELAWELMLWRCEAVARNHGISSEYPDTQQTILKWLQMQAEEDKHEAD